MLSCCLVTLPAHLRRIVSHRKQRGQRVGNSVQALRLRLLSSTSRASLAGAARNKKCQFSGPLPMTLQIFLHLKPSLGRPGAALKIWKHSPACIQVISNETYQTNRQTNTRTELYSIYSSWYITHNFVLTKSVSLHRQLCGPHRTHDVQTIATDDPVVWCVPVSVRLPVCP